VFVSEDALSGRLTRQGAEEARLDDARMHQLDRRYTCYAGVACTLVHDHRAGSPSGKPNRPLSGGSKYNGSHHAPDLTILEGCIPRHRPSGRDDLGDALV